MAERKHRIAKQRSAGSPLEELLMDEHVRSWRTLMRAFHSVYQPLEQALLQEGCSIPRFQILFHLYFSPPYGAAQLAKELFVTRGNISTFLKRLQAEGLIAVSEKSPSQSRPLYVLTAKGKSLFEDLFPRHIKRVRRLMPVLKATSRSELEAVIESRNTDVYI